MNLNKKILGPYFTLIKIAALLLPVYLVFYGPIHDNQEKGKIHPLWKFIFTGFAIYIVIALIIII